MSRRMQEEQLHAKMLESIVQTSQQKSKFEIIVNLGKWDKVFTYHFFIGCVLYEMKIIKIIFLLFFTTICPHYFKKHATLDHNAENLPRKHYETVKFLQPFQTFGFVCVRILSLHVFFFNTYPLSHLTLMNLNEPHFHAFQNYLQ